LTGLTGAGAEAGAGTGGFTIRTKTTGGFETGRNRLVEKLGNIYYPYILFFKKR
jgi:ribosomal protein L15